MSDEQAERLHILLLTLRKPRDHGRFGLLQSLDFLQRFKFFLGANFEVGQLKALREDSWNSLRIHAAINQVKEVLPVGSQYAGCFFLLLRQIRVKHVRNGHNKDKEEQDEHNYLILLLLDLPGKRDAHVEAGSTTIRVAVLCEVLCCNGVRKNRVRLGDLNELVHCLRIVRVLVRMLLSRQLTVGALDLGDGRHRAHSEDLVRNEHGERRLVLHREERADAHEPKHADDGDSDCVPCVPECEAVYSLALLHPFFARLARAILDICLDDHFTEQSRRDHEVVCGWY